MSLDEMNTPVPQRSRRDPGDLVCPWKPFSWVVIGSTMILVAGIACGVFCSETLPTLLLGILSGIGIGLAMTLLATGWGAVISLQEGPKPGILFIVVPPYMFYYAVTRWRWMAQPSILFLCGVLLIICSIYLGLQRIPQLTQV